MFQIDAPETAYNDRVVAFLRQSNIMEILKEKTNAVVNHKSLRDKVSILLIIFVPENDPRSRTILNPKIYFLYF